MNIYHFLMNYKDRKDPFGDVARNIRAVPTFDEDTEDRVIYYYLDNSKDSLLKGSAEILASRYEYAKYPEEEKIRNAHLRYLSRRRA